MRSIYTEFRRSEHCFYDKEEGIGSHNTIQLKANGLPPLTGQQMMQLLFWKNYAANYAFHTSEKLKHSHILEKFTDTLQKLEKRASKTKENEKTLNSARFFKNLMEKMRKDPSYLGQMNRADANHLENQIDGYLSSGYPTDLADEIQELTRSIKRQYIDLDGPFDWHEPNSKTVSNRYYI